MTRFVLVSHGRAGTNFVMNNLGMHPDTRIFLEPFHEAAEIRQPALGKAWEPGTSSADFAYDRIWIGEKPVEGFKLFFNHAREDAVSADIWDRLRVDMDVKFIFLNRRNLLMKTLSDLRAVTTGVWHPTDPNYMQSQYGTQVEIQVALPALRRTLYEHYAGFHRVAEIFAAHDCIYLSYEDLVVNSTGCYAEILKFLGLAPQELVEPFRPGTLTPETTKVVNAASVRRFLARSIWADYLDTCPLV